MTLARICLPIWLREFQDGNLGCIDLTSSLEANMEAVLDLAVGSLVIIVPTDQDVKAFVKLLEERKFVEKDGSWVKDKTTLSLRDCDHSVVIVPKDAFVIVLRRDGDEREKWERAYVLTSK